MTERDQFRRPLGGRNTGDTCGSKNVTFLREPFFHEPDGLRRKRDASRGTRGPFDDGLLRYVHHPGRPGLVNMR